MTVVLGSPIVLSPREISRSQMLADLFLHAASADRQVDGILERFIAIGRRRKKSETVTLTDEEALHIDEWAIELQNTVTRFCAVVAPIALERIDLALPFMGDDYDGHLGGVGLDESDPLIRPLFEKSGIADRFVPWQKMHPDTTAGDAEERD